MGGHPGLRGHRAVRQPTPFALLASLRRRRDVRHARRDRSGYTIRLRPAGSEGIGRRRLRPSADEAPLPAGPRPNHAASLATSPRRPFGLWDAIRDGRGPRGDVAEGWCQLRLEEPEEALLVWANLVKAEMVEAGSCVLVHHV